MGNFYFFHFEKKFHKKMLRETCFNGKNYKLNLTPKFISK
jgi:hypothetical protein